MGSICLRDVYRGLHITTAAMKWGGYDEAVVSCYCYSILCDDWRYGYNPTNNSKGVDALKTNAFEINQYNRVFY